MTEKKTIKKPWGHEIIWAETKDYVGKLLYIKSGHKLSLQYHQTKEETIMVVSGALKLYYGENKEKLNEKKLKVGDNFHVKPNLIHRFSAEYGDVELVEVSTPHLKDVVRLEDDYNRS